jgi:hypothetical protein
MPTPPIRYADGPRLLANIGAGSALFALETAPGCIGDVASLPCDHYRRFEDAALDYLTSVAQRQRGSVHHAVIAIAIARAQTADGAAQARHRWEDSIAAARVILQLDTLLVVSDQVSHSRQPSHGTPAGAIATWQGAASIPALRGAAAMLAAALGHPPTPFSDTYAH